MTLEKAATRRHSDAIQPASEYSLANILVPTRNRSRRPRPWLSWLLFAILLTEAIAVFCEVIF